MAATAAQLLRLREMIAGACADDITDVELADVLERYAVADDAGNEPTATAWTATYDLHAAAAGFWTTQAGVLAKNVNFSADGLRMDRSQAHAQALAMARLHLSQRVAK